MSRRRKTERDEAALHRCYACGDDARTPVLRLPASLFDEAMKKGARHDQDVTMRQGGNSYCPPCYLRLFRGGPPAPCDDVIPEAAGG